MTLRKLVNTACLCSITMLCSQLAYTMPFFEIIGGDPEVQAFGGVQIIPNGAYGFENREATSGAEPQNNNPISVVLRDPGSVAGERRTIRFDYIGTDARFTNQFTAGTGAEQFTWCNKNNATCSAGADRLGQGNNDFFDNYAETRYINAVVDELIPFTFFAQIQTHDHAINNGESIYDSHLGVFNIQNGFDFIAPPDRSGTVLAIGLTDGEYAQADNDHQDFIIRISTVPEPNVILLMLAGLLASVASRRRKL